ncbi:hypothetical protein Dthio_PD2135 [Desulfonatronospira thiodismutans ASO3-1]|uniref:CRISPR-associated protein n=1 Tax=Desulfonatronospira thiodismutans ASO3-1 TaxID=555779 RepID=D6SPT3_9BACT|nr:TIGR03986 family CRISPR-associated RAMP protein [Desulfonatronospira thiodismutans]EFI34759.1 hypothetical protein Dthio_PD2135 [Desulfonatronospira thiodismutans ASO3-1]
MSKDREFFINPYTFVPLDKSGPVIEVPENGPDNAHHLYFEKDCFTGRLEVELSFITPAVIPGDQQAGTEKAPGSIKLYRHNDKLAIPGSRLRGHLFNLMKAINSSPVTAYNDRAILAREPGDHQKGYIIQENGQLYVVKINDEILMAAQDRSGKLFFEQGKPKTKLTLSNGADIIEFNVDSPKSGTYGELHYGHPKNKTGKYKKYLSDSSGISVTGNWVYFPSWSGQDGLNEIKDINNKTKAHKIDAHIVDIKQISNRRYRLDKDVVEKFQKNVSEMAKLLQDRGECSSKVYNRVRQMSELKPGMFVYFEANGDTVTSIGRHYRYLSHQGSIEETVERTNKELSNKTCLLPFTGGFASDSDSSEGLKSRLWVDMARCITDEPPVEEKNLRILSSQPPKAACFYLNGKGYDDNKATIRGRKFYWHDSKWRWQLWDNHDQKCGLHAFENPFPNENKKQWARSEVIMADENTHVSFRFSIRFMNLSRDEIYLLMTAIEGFDKNEDGKQWMHKIGHARPFIGSACMTVNSMHVLGFDSQYLKPVVQNDDLEVIRDDLASWQEKFEQKRNIQALKRIMSFEGAYYKAKTARIMYPVKYKDNSTPNWKDSSDAPKTFEWFVKQDKGKVPPPVLPDPASDEPQYLPINWTPQNRGGQMPGKGPQGKKKSSKGGKR